MRIFFATALILLSWHQSLFAAPSDSIRLSDDQLKKIEVRVQSAMDRGDIPGVSLVVIKGDELIIRNYGYADLSKRELVQSTTRFELASCSKAFTALAILKLESAGHLSLDDKVSNYLPWFKASYKETEVSITVGQLLHHTSGIPWSTLSLIPEDASADALLNAVKQINGIELKEKPGSKYEYASMNYDVLGLIIESITHSPYEMYMQTEIFAPLSLSGTSVGESNQVAYPKSVGYKAGYFQVLPYSPPPYKGNAPSAYIESNAVDIAKWLQIQLGKGLPEWQSLIARSHQPDLSVKPLGSDHSYASGWNYSMYGSPSLHHIGENPNFTSFIGFVPEQGAAVAVLANANSKHTFLLGKDILKQLSGESVFEDYDADDGYDKSFSLLTLVLGFYSMLTLALIVLSIIKIRKQKDGALVLNAKKLISVVSITLFFALVLYGIYIFPKAFSDFTWSAMLVWLPYSLKGMLVCAFSAIAFTYLAFFISILFEFSGKTYWNMLPFISIVSLISGIANMIIIVLITSVVRGDLPYGDMLIYFAITFIAYIGGRKIIENKLLEITNQIIFELRVKLVDKIFSTTYEKFERIDRGKIYSTLNNDTSTLGDAASVGIKLITSIITVVGAFFYLAVLSFWATVVTVTVIAALVTLYYYVGKRANALYEEARNTHDEYMKLLNGMIDGFKELSIHRAKKTEFHNEVKDVSERYRTSRIEGQVRFVNAFLIGESILILVLAAVAFVMPRVFPDLESYKLVSFVIVLLYLIGPINSILGSVPDFINLKVSWNRIQGFMNDIPATIASLSERKRVNIPAKVARIDVETISYHYENNAGASERSFGIGPVNFSAEGGEAIFIIGGNGSGKTTLAKVLTGLYPASEGAILINGKTVDHDQLGEFYSTVFNPNHLFEKIYAFDNTHEKKTIDRYLGLLGLDQKISLVDNVYSTVNLSGGQRKRIALLQCYLEDKPIFLFDEWAADQDPEYRKFFYRTLIPEMKAAGKIIIAITHDDQYFDLADKVLKVESGKIKIVQDRMAFQDLMA